MSLIAFGGRQEIISDISRTANRLFGRSLAGRTYVIGGAPGAGKTALARETIKRLAAADNQEKKPIQSVFCPYPQWKLLLKNNAGFIEGMVREITCLPSHKGTVL